jgi:hypothetical protein
MGEILSSHPKENLVLQSEQWVAPDTEGNSGFCYRHSIYSLREPWKESTPLSVSLYNAGHVDDKDKRACHHLI